MNYNDRIRTLATAAGADYYDLHGLLDRLALMFDVRRDDLLEAVEDLRCRLTIALADERTLAFGQVCEGERSDEPRDVARRDVDH